MSVSEKSRSNPCKSSLLDGVTAVRVLSLLTLAVAELLFQYLSFANASLVAISAFLMLVLSIARFFALREWILLLLCLFLAIGLWRRDAHIDNVLLALNRAAFFAAFIYLVTLLKEAALRSGSVAQLGLYLTRQPPRRRYFSLAAGGHLLGVLLNFGAISLLTPLIQKGSKQVSEKPVQVNLVNTSASKILEQQQISALLRGFSWMIMWSPTALTQAVLYTAIPSANPAIVIPMGIAAAIVMILLGRWEDWMRWRTLVPLTTKVDPVFPKRAARRFLIVCSCMIALTIITMLFADVSAAHALMLVAPIIMVIWIFAQTNRQVASESKSKNHLQDTKLIAITVNALQTLMSIIVGSSRVLGISSFTLGAAGFVGVTAASLAPVDTLALQIEVLNMPEWLFLMCLPLLIIAGGQIALSPLLVVVFLSSILNQFPALPADPNLIVFALGAGWALSMTAAPNASATLLISGVTGISPTTLTWRWNGTYALLCLAAFFVSFYILTKN